MVISSILTPGACSGQLVEVESIRNLLKSHGIGQVLFVGHDEQAAVPQLILTHEPAQLISALLHPVSVVAVHHKYDHVCVLVVVTPQWTLQQELDDAVNDKYKTSSYDSYIQQIDFELRSSKAYHALTILSLPPTSNAVKLTFL